MNSHNTRAAWADLGLACIFATALLMVAAIAWSGFQVAQGLSRSAQYRSADAAAQHANALSIASTARHHGALQQASWSAAQPHAAAGSDLPACHAVGRAPKTRSQEVQL